MSTPQAGDSVDLPKSSRKKKSKRDDAKPKGNPAIAGWGLNLIVIGLVGLLLPSVGLSFRKLQAIGDAQWIVLACVVAVGSGAFFWGNRHRLGFAGAIAGGALAMVPVLAYVSFWRHPKAPQQIANPAPMHRPQQPIVIRKPDPPPPGGLRGRIEQINVEISGDLTDDELALISECVQDCLPDAQWASAYLPTRKSRQSDVADTPVVGMRPVPSAEQFLAQLSFGTVTTISPDRIRIEVRRPLPPPAESVRNRAAAALDALRSGDAARQELAVMKLEKLPPHARREEVAAELLLLFSTPKSSHSTYKAFKRWAVPEQAEAIKALVGQDGINIIEAFDVLGAIALDDAVQVARGYVTKDEHLAKDDLASLSQAERLARLGQDERTESLAKQLLARLGAPAEKAVIEFLQDPDPKVRKVGVEVLKSIGTEASIEPLKALENDPNATEARRAVGIIQGRIELDRKREKGL
jgi:hypothetical protein